MPTLFEGMRPFRRAGALRDARAGIVLAAMNIPQVLGYTRIAGMPVVTGLYTLLAPISAFAVAGSSRFLVVSADSATAAILAGGLAGMAPLASARYVVLAGWVALLTAGFLLSGAAVQTGLCRRFPVADGAGRVFDGGGLSGGDRRPRGNHRYRDSLAQNRHAIRRSLPRTGNRPCADAAGFAFCAGGRRGSEPFRAQGAGAAGGCSRRHGGERHLAFIRAWRGHHRSASGGSAASGLPMAAGGADSAALSHRRDPALS